ncbi:MAG TPA: alkaline phosphatase family protein [Acidobacteriota bacterium]|nr:alkaline phosphatase family protein [Acidobacteriota bacterium]
MIILGFDGMDPGILESLMLRGRLPTFSRLRASGDFRRLRTSLPPQSPVAWSNFITGMDPGGHGIFDFIHRTPEDYTPYLSTSRVTPAKWTVKLGDYVLPLSSGKVELLRKGRAFWQMLEEKDIPATVVQVPSNFPPVETSQRTLSGMGTPDILGTYGIFNFYTTQGLEMAADIGGGKVNLVQIDDDIVSAEIEGPPNSFRKRGGASTIPFKVYLDPVNPVAKIRIQNDEFILKEGEWSAWKRIHFPMIPTQSAEGICRFYLKQVHPEFQLYVSPVNLDPASPALPISTPASYSRELESHIGPFFTKGLPADTKALDQGVLDEGEFLTQDESVLEESLKLFEYELARFESGLWFHYFSNTDQRQHMFLRLLDKADPLYNPDLVARHEHAVEHVYSEMDRVLARTMSKVDEETLLMVMSDHGFMPFRRSFNLNTWLLLNGYMKLLDPAMEESPEFFANTDWSGTRAYALGLNGLYVNVRGREGKGIVDPTAETQALIKELAGNLEKVTDPLTGERVISKAYIARQCYHGPMVDQAPDIIVGYNKGYRASWATPLGRAPRDIFEENESKWGADHCMDPVFLPGILLTNRKVKSADPALYDLTATILSAFGVEKPPEVIGESVL